jgi:hypothetical protein
VRVECAVLCDAASVREGLLHILGAGVTTSKLVDFPRPLPVTFAFRAVLESRELRDRHTLSLEIVNYAGDVEATAELVFEVQDSKPSTEEAALTAPIPLGGFTVNRPGKYLIKATLDGRVVGTFPLQVDEGPAAAIAG